MTTQYFEQLSPAYLAHYCRRLSSLIIDQGTQILSEMGLVTPAASISAIVYIEANSPVSAATLAEALGVSHQMATQRVNELEKLKLIRRVHSKQDKRVKQIVLTPLANKEIKQLKPFTEKVEQAFRQLESDLECELMSIIRKAELALLAKPLCLRISESVND